MNKVKIGIVGVGDISGIYLENLTNKFKEIEVTGVCDLIRERAEKAAEKYKIANIYETMHDVFADPQIDIVLNLTRPYEHFEVSLAALKAGKHVYSEKPLGATLEEGKELVRLAEENGFMLGGAPDTFMGAGIQTCRKLIDDGFIGTPVGAAAFMICRGHESWHHDPDFYYQRGGGPMMDMGPYYLTALVNLLGGVEGVTGMAKTFFPTRTITSHPHFGETIKVNVPTFVTGTLQFQSGAIGTIFTTFDVHYMSQARLEIYGSAGTLIVPDPNGFGGPVQLLRAEDGNLRQIPLLFGYQENSRALGLADMAKALQTGRRFRANHHLTFHVLEIMETIMKSSEQKRYLPLESGFTREKPMEPIVIPGVLD
ncbi:MAG: Gfo/Idh/MocA family protein [Saccharofermentanales bacterium]